MTRTVDRKPITQAMQLALWKLWGRATCCVCGVEVCLAWSDPPFHWDHHQALVDGGKHDIENIRPVCAHCHKIKSAHEHKENARAKRRARKHSQPTPPSRMTHPTLKRKVGGRVVPRNPASADNTGA